MTSIHALGILFCIMTRVTDTRQPSLSYGEQSISAPSVSSVPAGSGNARTTISSAVEPASAPNKGYIEPIVERVRDWITLIWDHFLSLLKCVCPCYFKEEAVARDTQAEEVVARDTQAEEVVARDTQAEENIPEVPPPPEPPQIVECIRLEINLRNAFDRLTKREQELIFNHIGRAAYSERNPLRDFLMRFKSFESIGREKVDGDPLILNEYLILTQH